MWEVAQALGKALDTAATARTTDAARGGAAEVLSGLAAAVAELRKAAEAPAAVPEGGFEVHVAGVELHAPVEAIGMHLAVESATPAGCKQSVPGGIAVSHHLFVGFHC